MNRVRFFESNDLLYGHNLTKIEDMGVPDISEIGINDAIEFFEIKKYFDYGTQSVSWEMNDFQAYLAKSNTLYKLTLQFFNGIDDTTIVERYQDTETYYRKVFWQLFDICKLYKKISNDVFEELIHVNSVAPFDLFRYKNIVHCYGGALREYLLEKANYISILLHVYNQDVTPGEKLYLPKELTSEDICSIFDRYIDSERPNINILKRIELMRPTERFPISDELRLRAKRRHIIEIEKYSDTAASIEFGIKLSFDPHQTQEKLNLSSEEGFHLSYSTQWLLETLDYPSILNNFIFVFEYVDVPQIRFQHVSKASDLSILERISMPTSSRMYSTGMGFDLTNALALMQMMAYYNFLSSNGIRLEDVLKWVFTEYFQNEYKCPELRVIFPSESITYAEKCTTIIAAMETILKQFSLYVKNGQVDFDLVAMSSSPMLFKDIPSLLTHKYVYGVGNDFAQITFLLFSDQCLLTYVERVEKQNKSYKCLFELLSHEEIFMSDYRENDQSSFRYLEQHEVVFISNEGRIRLGNTKKLLLLIDLYKNEVISRWHYGKDFQSTIQDWIDNGFLKESNGLLSFPEINYLNYLLNRAEYDNGLEIRNRYVHGVQQVSLNEEEHKQNYFILLRIMVLLAIKINDEFELKELLGNGCETES